VKTKTSSASRSQRVERRNCMRNSSMILTAKMHETRPFAAVLS
jgi:hypothetical protein